MGGFLGKRRKSRPVSNWTASWRCVRSEVKGRFQQMSKDFWANKKWSCNLGCQVESYFLASANLLIFARHLYEYQNENTSDLQRRFVLRLDYSVRYVYYYVYSPQRRLLIKGPNPTSRTIILLLSPAKKEMKKETKNLNCVCVSVEVGNWGQTNKKLGETVLKLCISICVWLCVFVSLCVYIYVCVCFLGVANWVCVCMHVCVCMCV